jgi:hypothetical protein
MPERNSVVVRERNALLHTSGTCVLLCREASRFRVVHESGASTTRINGETEWCCFDRVVPLLRGE